MSALSESIRRMDTTARTAPDDEAAKTESAITPILLDIVIPLGIYYLLHDGLGMSLVTSMACSSILPAIRTISVGIRDHRLDTLAALMLTLCTVPFLLYRVIAEDRVLHAELPGYSDYAARVRWRLIPGVW